MITKYLDTIFGLLALLYLLFRASLATESAETALLINALCGGFIFLWPAVVGLRHLLKIFRYHQAYTERTYEDVSYEKRPLVPEVQHFSPLLEQLGFTHIGEIERQMPGQADLTVWCYRRYDGLVMASVMWLNQTSAIQFSTLFPDQAILGTSFPFGLDLNLPIMRAITASPNEGPVIAYQKHQQAGSEMMQLHGYPTAINMMEDYLHAARTEELHMISILPMLWRKALTRDGAKLYPILWIVLLSLLLIAFGGYEPLIGLIMLPLLIPLAIAIFLNR